MITVAPGRVFRRNPVTPVLAAIVISVVNSGIAVFAIPEFLPIATTRQTRAILAIAVAVVAVIATWAVIMWTRNIRVVVTQDAVEVRRPFQVLHTVPRAGAEFGGRVTRERTWGIQSGATYELLGRTPSTGFTQVLPWFSRRTFEALVAELRGEPAPVSR